MLYVSILLPLLHDCLHQECDYHWHDHNILSFIECALDCDCIENAIFKALGCTLAAGTFFSLLTTSAFLIAVRNQQEDVVPIFAARTKETTCCANPIDKVQDRGNPCFMWIRCTLIWSYETLLRGTPGTRTQGVRCSYIRHFQVSYSISESNIFLKLC